MAKAPAAGADVLDLRQAARAWKTSWALAAVLLRRLQGHRHRSARARAAFSVADDVMAKPAAQRMRELRARRADAAAGLGDFVYRGKRERMLQALNVEKYLPDWDETDDAAVNKAFAEMVEDWLTVTVGVDEA